jgi:hypothetical protein
MSVTVENRRNRLRSAVAAVLTVLLLVPVSILFLQIWRSTTDDRDTATRERHGVEYLTQLGPLLTALAEAQAAAMQGGPAPAALQTAATSVGELDNRLGTELGTHDRWSGLKKEIDALPSASGGPVKVFQAHVEAQELLLALYRAVRDNAILTRDPDNDISHLQQAIGDELPTAVTQAARMADLSMIVGSVDGIAKQQLGAQLAASFQSVDAAVGRMTDDLQSAREDTASGTLSSSLLAPLDSFRAGIEGLVRGASAPAPNAAALSVARTKMQQSVTGLSGTALGETDALLRTRLTSLDTERRNMLIVVGAAALLALLAVVIPVTGRRRPSAPPGRAAPASAAHDWDADDFGPRPGLGASLHDPTPQRGDEAPATRRERSGALR